MSCYNCGIHSAHVHLPYHFLEKVWPAPECNLSHLSPKKIPKEKHRPLHIYYSIPLAVQMVNFDLKIWCLLCPVYYHYEPSENIIYKGYSLALNICMIVMTRNYRFSTMKIKENLYLLVWNDIHVMYIYIYISWSKCFVPHCTVDKHQWHTIVEHLLIFVKPFDFIAAHYNVVIYQIKISKYGNIQIKTLNNVIGCVLEIKIGQANQ